MQFTNNFGVNCTPYALGLLQGLITQDEFELLCMVLPKH